MFVSGRQTEAQPEPSLAEKVDGILYLDKLEDGTGERQPYSLLKRKLGLSYGAYVRLVDQGLLKMPSELYQPTIRAL
jgi:hypothetical protein